MEYFKVVLANYAQSQAFMALGWLLQTGTFSFLKSWKALTQWGTYNEMQHLEDSKAEMWNYIYSYIFW